MGRHGYFKILIKYFTINKTNTFYYQFICSKLDCCYCNTNYQNLLYTLFDFLLVLYFCDHLHKIYLSTQFLFAQHPIKGQICRFHHFSLILQSLDVQSMSKSNLPRIRFSSLSSNLIIDLRISTSSFSTRYFILFTSKECNQTMGECVAHQKKEDHLGSNVQLRL